MWLQKYKQPISDDASTLSVTASWAVQCFVPLVNTLADEFGSEPTAICEAVWCEFPQCNVVPTTEAEVELRKRIETAVAAILQQDPAWLNALLGAT
jgi:hypothetical protein